MMWGKLLPLWGVSDVELPHPQRTPCHRLNESGSYVATVQGEVNHLEVL